MKIGVDLDHVLAGWDKSFISLLNTVSGKHANIAHHPGVWDYFEHELGFTPEEVKKAWAVIEKQPYAFWEAIEPLPFAVALIEFLSELATSGKHEIYFITKRYPRPQVKKASETWLQEHGFKGTPTVICCDNKGNVAVGIGLDLMIEDSPAYSDEVITASPKTTVFLVNWKYNESYHADLRGTLQDAFLYIAKHV